MLNKKPGRKPKPHKKRQELKISEDVLDFIKNIADEHKKTLSDTVEEIISEYIKNTTTRVTFENYITTGRIIGVDQEIEFSSCGPYFIRGIHTRTEDNLTIDPSSPYIYLILKCTNGASVRDENDGEKLIFKTLREAFECMIAIIKKNNSTPH